MTQMLAMIWELAIFGRHCRDIVLVNRWTTHEVLISLASPRYEVLLIKAAVQDYAQQTIKSIVYLCTNCLINCFQLLVCGRIYSI